MTTVINKTANPGLIQLIASVLLAISFFLPWVSWSGTEVTGLDMATGQFFQKSDAGFGVTNPFPQFGFLFYAFWLIPVLAIVVAGLVLAKKKTIPFAFLTGAMSLALLTVYVLFSNTLIDLGAGKSVIAMLKPAAIIHALAAIVLIITAYQVKNKAWKLGWLLIGPVIAFAGFKVGEKYVMGETHTQTEQVKADYQVTADSLIHEFISNDTAANRKYREKMLIVNGQVSQVDILADSTSTIQFADSSGSYAIFSFEKNQLPELTSIKAGEPVSIKAVCSGSIFSEILGTTSISFKRATIIKK